MTLPNRPRDHTPPDKRQTEAPTRPLASEEPTAVADTGDTHVDYDRNPLSVRSLDHYIESPAGDGRFHISG